MSKDDLLLNQYKIHSSAISVVIQGLLYRNHAEGDLASRAIASIRQHLPDAEIIISTWPHQSISNLIVDQVVISAEPACFIDENGEVNNVVRQIISTQKGIAVSTRPYVLKFRADHYLSNDNIAVLTEYAGGKHLFKQPITLTNLFIRDPVHVPMLFHLSDLIHFGCKEDLLDLWTIRLPEFDEVFYPRIPKWRIFGNLGGYSAMRQAPEQTIMLGWLKKHGISISLPHVYYSSYALLKLWEENLTHHFFVMNWQRSGIIFPDRFHNIFHMKNANYTEQTLASIKQKLTGRGYYLRYIQLLMNKYVTCWFKLAYVRGVMSNILFSLSPTFAKRIRTFYREKIKGKTFSKR